MLLKDKLIAYISGPISGMPNRNIEAFDEAQILLDSLGYEPINPINNDNRSHDKSWHYYMKLDIVHVAQSDLLVLLPGWEKSKGAVIEIALAERLEIPLYELNLETKVLTPIYPKVTITAERPEGK